jgi:hydrogenase expression/formation protein HypC
MCLAIPAKVVELLADDQAVVEMEGVRKQISLALLDEIVVGDYVIVHVGFALSKVDPEEAEQTLAMFAQLGAMPTASS